MPDPVQLPHLVKLADDPSDTVRAAVLGALATFGDELEPALGALDPPLDSEQLAALLAQVEAHRRGDPAGPLFRVGQVVRHRRFGYRALVVAADEACRGPAGPGANQPWYHLLVHGSDGVTYTAQASLEHDVGARGVRHPLVSRYFRGFHDGRYLRNDVPWEGG